MSQFIAMGGYGIYVWPAYAVSVLGVGGILWATLHDYARARRHLAELEGDKRS